MIAQFGQLFLILALVFALATAFYPLIGVLTDKATLQRTAVIYARLLYLFLGLAFLSLVYAFSIDDFSLIYVATNSSRELPLMYKLCAVWGGHEGSMLLWVMILSTWMVAITFFRKPLSDVMLARVLVVLASVAIGFLLFILATSNPFTLLYDNIPLNGRDLNPLLQDPGFIFHPPMLYMGYVGFSVSFAFAIAALWAGDIKSQWARWAAPWTMAAWCCLTTGITLGSWWAYRELGWGGWWFWDPVENASFMPWLVGTALFHSLHVTAKRNTLANWTVLLSLCAFCLSLIGTFLVRSGVLTSVHAFAVDPARGFYMLGFLLVVIGFSLGLFALRSHRLNREVPLYAVSRESLLIVNNLLLTVAMLTVLLGTLYPLIIDGLGLGKLSVGAPYFNAVFIPLFLPIFFLVGIAPFVSWGNDTLSNVLTRIKPALIASSMLACLTVMLLSFEFKLMALFTWFLFYWIVCANLLHIKKLYPRYNRHSIAMVIAHSALAVILLGISLSTLYGSERFVKMTVGKTVVSLAGYQVKLNSLHQLQGPNYGGVEATMDISRANYHKTIYPQKRRYQVQQTVMTDSAIDVNPFRDIYIALGEPLTNQSADLSWSVRIYYKPFIRWIWGGGFLLLLAGLLSLLPGRKKQYIPQSLKQQVTL